MIETVAVAGSGQEPEALSALYGFGAVAHTELPIHGARVLFDRVLGQMERVT
jgi:hypothetical protein